MVIEGLLHVYTMKPSKKKSLDHMEAGWIWMEHHNTNYGSYASICCEAILMCLPTETNIPLDLKMRQDDFESMYWLQSHKSSVSKAGRFDSMKTFILALQSPAKMATVLTTLHGSHLEVLSFGYPKVPKWCPWALKKVQTCRWGPFG